MVDDADEQVAGNGLLDRRLFLKTGLAGSAALMSAAAIGKEREPWMRAPGGPMSEAGLPSDHEAHVRRSGIRSSAGTTGTGVSFTPLEHLHGVRKRAVPIR